MKKLLMVSLMLSFAIFVAFGQNLTVNATIDQKLAVSFDGTLDFTIALAGVGAAASSDTATMNVISNKKDWTVSFNSQNDGFLVSADANVTEGIPYTLQAILVEPTTPWIRTSLVNELDDPVTPEGVSITVDGGKTQKAGVNFTLQAFIAAQADNAVLYGAAAYQDTVVVTIVSP